MEPRNLGLWESAKQSLGEILEESPGSLGRVPGNAWGARAYDQCSREQTADGRFADQVRVKGCGKSAPRGWQQFVAR